MSGRVPYSARVLGRVMCGVVLCRITSQVALVGGDCDVLEFLHFVEGYHGWINVDEMSDHG